ncbi:SDR family oxidoreductase [Calothrix rhizosoleniae]|uniref:SDR family oxidoreductase n=1 Tax=Calothrix rhizosoleniae TaxID=888997 RepID=UPI000B49CA33|nr:SDR family oxidoreductase [Calothrix rhizosoleniae]
MNITIIGCGYVGYALAKYWQDRMSLMITATTTTIERIPELQAVSHKVVVVKGDDSAGLKSILKDQDVAILSIGSKKFTPYEETYLQTAKNLVPVLQDNSTLKQLIYTSSSSIYGNQDGVVVDEQTPPNPTSSTGKVLRETEEVLMTASNERLRVCILRLGGIYGPGRELVKIYSRVAGKTRPGNGQQPANWIHLDDIVGGIELARHQHLQGIYNLVDDANLTNREVIDRVCEQHNLPKVIWDSSQSSQRQYNANISNQKIKDAGYKLLHPNMIF